MATPGPVDKAHLDQLDAMLQHAMTPAAQKSEFTINNVTPSCFLFRCTAKDPVVHEAVQRFCAENGGTFINVMSGFVLNNTAHEATERFVSTVTSTTRQALMQPSHATQPAATTPTSPQTGDDAGWLIWLPLALLAAAGAAFAAFMGLRRRGK